MKAAVAIVKLQQLLTDLKMECKVVPKIYRTRAGIHQRSMGAWSWWVYVRPPQWEGTIGGLDLGSQWSLTEVLAAHRDQRVVLYQARPYGVPAGSWELIVESVAHKEKREKGAQQP